MINYVVDEIEFLDNKELAEKFDKANRAKREVPVTSFMGVYEDMDSIFDALEDDKTTVCYDVVFRRKDNDKICVLSDCYVTRKDGKWIISPENEGILEWDNNSSSYYYRVFDKIVYCELIGFSDIVVY